MNKVDFIIIAQSEVVDYEEYSRLPLARIELFRELVYPRMVYYEGRFRSHLELINQIEKESGFLRGESADKKLSIWNLPAYSGMHLANYLWAYGIRTAIINNFDGEWDRFRQVYEANERPLVGISTTFYLSHRPIQKVVRRLRELDGDMEIVLGGAMVNEQMIDQGAAALEKLMSKYQIDYILHAFNSESDLRELILARRTGRDFGRVNNLLRRERADGRISQTMVKWNEPILNEIKPCWEELELGFVNQTVQMRTSSGCPFACAFCSYPQTARGYHTMGLEEVEKHIQSILRVPGVKRIVFIDDTFNVPAERFQGLCRMFSKYDFEWFSFLRVQFVDEQTAQLMRQSGCRAVYLGIESASDTVLRNMNKKASRSDYARGMGWLKKYGITTMAALVIGFPGETAQTIQEDIDFIEKEQPDFYTLKEFYYLHHTPIHKESERFGLVGQGNDWRHDTMDCRQAHQAKEEMFKTIKNSVFVDPDMNLWYLAYLYDQGYSLGQIKQMQKEINTLMKTQMEGDFSGNHPAIQRLRQMRAEKVMQV